MQPATRFFFVLLILFAGSTRPVLAQQPVPVVDSSSFGDKIVLNNGWLFHAGDDPEWSSPTLDDRGWSRVDLHANLADYGVPADTQFGWLRLHVRLRPSGPPPVFGTQRTYGRYQVFANGYLIGSVGDMNEHTLYDRDFMTQFPIPPRVLTGAASGGPEVVLAVRCSFQTPPYGVERPTPLLVAGHAYLGTSRALTEMGRDFWVLDVVPFGANLLPSLVVAFFAAALFLAVRNRRDYLLLSLFCIFSAAGSLDDYRTWTNAYTLPETILQAFLALAEYLALLAFVRELIGGRYLRVFAFLTAILAFGCAVLPLWAAGLVPWFFSSLDYLSALVFNAGLFLLLVHAFRQGTAALRRDLLPVLLGMGAETFASLLNNLRVAARFSFPLPQVIAQMRYPSFGPFSFSYDTIADVVFTLCLLVFLVDRTVRIARERNRSVAELEAAQTVQRLLLSRSAVPTPGFAVDRVYRPASEVGGDFFLLSPLEQDGSLLAVVGDVSGKGLAAAMNVSMILGVLRNEVSRAPSQVLKRLNDALLAQGGSGFTTACCVHLTSAGEYVIANAGHIAPYLGGEEVETVPALPLGLAPDQEYPTSSGRLLREQRMTLLTDGVPEARASDGKLLGFDQLGRLTLSPAEAIADAAQAFGQDDDITVVTIALQT
jgi:hypothetical protein